MMVDIVFPSSAEAYVVAQCNGDKNLYREMPDAYHAISWLKKLKPQQAIDIGAGIGRASAYFHKRFGWDDTTYHYIDGDRGTQQFKGIRFEKGEYYNSWDAAREFSMANGISSIVQWDPEEGHWRENIRDAELAYSFLAVGFHWPLDMYLKDLHQCLAPQALLFFGLRGTSATRRPNPDYGFAASQADRVPRDKYAIEALHITPKARRTGLLVLRKK